ncbi:MAG: glycosyltransferase family 87 protein [Asticcacaulis sp.]|uniref:glycosyltransferase family 87 protein n=1 Tax=Asticcacaulis sp. TaxID=1872648 RepID=UPI003F7C3D8A
MTFLNPLRRMDSFTPERARLYSRFGAAGFVLLAVIIWFKFTVLHPTGDPMGGDFVSFWAASKLALNGHAVDAWNPALHAAAENSLFSGPHGYLAFFYPPPYLLLCSPLALVPYGWSALLWMAATTALSLWATWRALGKRLPLAALLAFPAVWINIGCGQNGALSLAILSGGFVLMPRRPILSGLILGCLVIKPQLAIALPFVLGGAALAQPRYWKTFIATGASALCLCGLSWLAFGHAGWSAFLVNSVYARETLHRGLVDPALMQSLFAGLRVIGIAFTPAFAAQILLSLSVLSAAAWLSFRHRLEGAALGALAVAATVLATPFMLDYDLVILALPLGWLCVEGAQKGFRNWEKLLLLIVFFLPLVSRKLAQDAHLPLAPPILLILFALTLTRILRPVQARNPQAVTSPC